IGRHSMNQPAADEPVELVAIINSFNRRSLLERAITSLTGSLRRGQLRTAIVVFEAGSTDGSAEFLQSWRSDNPRDNLIVIRPSSGRSSFSDGVNAACAEAISRFPNCRWLFLYETDNSLEDVAPITNAITLLEHEPKLGAAGFTVKQYNGNFFGYGM